MTFKDAVTATLDIETCYQTGLKAFGANSKKVKLKDTTKCERIKKLDIPIMVSLVNEPVNGHHFTIQDPSGLPTTPPDGIVYLGVAALSTLK